MKYIITESQLRNNIDYLKEPMFMYWDMNGGKNYTTAMKLFTIPPAATNLVQSWLLEWMGGEDELYKKLKKYEGRDFRGIAGSYNFKFYLDNVRIYTHDGVEIYVDAVVDGDGEVHIEYPNYVINNIYQAIMDENINSEVDDEIRDTIDETLDEIIDIEFLIDIADISVTEPGMYNND